MTLPAVTPVVPLPSSWLDLTIHASGCPTITRLDPAPPLMSWDPVVTETKKSSSSRMKVMAENYQPVLFGLQRGLSLRRPVAVPKHIIHGPRLLVGTASFENNATAHATSLFLVLQLAMALGQSFVFSCLEKK